MPYPFRRVGTRYRVEAKPAKIKREKKTSFLASISVLGRFTQLYGLPSGETDGWKGELETFSSSSPRGKFHEYLSYVFIMGPAASGRPAGRPVAG